MKEIPPNEAVQKIGRWKERLCKHDHEDVRAVVTDLSKLKKLLAAKQPDDQAITTLRHKLGKDTAKVFEDAEKANMKHVHEIGEALAAAT